MDERVVALTAAQAGERLDRAIAAALPDVSRTQVQRLIEAGCVQVNGVPWLKPGLRLAGGESVSVRLPPPAPAAAQAEAIPLDVIYEDDDLAVINKPAGMVVHPAAGHAGGTLVNAILAHAPGIVGVGDEARPGIVHRLDKDTSGLIVIAKNNRAQRQLQEQFNSRAVEKTYLALLDGHPPTDAGRIEAPIGRDPRDRKRMAVVRRGGREAVTEYRLVEKFRDHALAEVRPITGRTHQIRVHFAFLGCPVAGDTVYGRRQPTAGLRRHCLHAAKIMLRLPSSGERMMFEADLPDELEAVLLGLRSGL